MLNDYARTPVPSSASVSGWRIALIYIGVGLALPAFLVGAQIGQALGLGQTLLAVLAAGIILTLTASFTGAIGAKVRLSTYMLAQITFGKIGAKFINLLIACSLFGWFGVTITLFAQAIDGLFISQFGIDIGVTLWSIFAGVLMISTAIWGFKGLDKLSMIAVPLIFGLLIITNWRTLSTVSPDTIVSYQGNGSLPFGVAVSILVGSWMVGAATLPDLARYCKNGKGATLGAFISFLPGLLMIMTLSIIPALATEQTDIVRIMTSFGWPVMSTMILLLAAWSTNDNNLYSSSLGLASIIPKIAKWKITLVSGIIGTVLAILGIMEGFITFLVLLGIVMPPIAGVYSVDYFLRKSEYHQAENPSLSSVRPIALFAWLIGSGVAFITFPVSSGGLELARLTGISALDGLLAGAVIHLALKLLIPAKPAKKQRQIDAK